MLLLFLTLLLVAGQLLVEPAHGQVLVVPGARPVFLLSRSGGPCRNDLNCEPPLWCDIVYTQTCRRAFRREAAQLLSDRAGVTAGWRKSGARPIDQPSSSP